MCCGKCGNKGKHLCPVSFGLAVGITSGLAIFIWSIWAMYYGIPPMMAALHLPPPTWLGGIVHALLGLLKGFLFGFFIALFYDLFACCFRGMCGKKSEGGCGCGCECCGTKKPEMKR